MEELVTGSAAGTAAEVARRGCGYPRGEEGPSAPSVGGGVVGGVVDAVVGVSLVLAGFHYAPDFSEHRESLLPRLRRRGYRHATAGCE